MSHRVVVLALDGVLPFELGFPQGIFGRSMSVRTFTRRFREEVGISPGQCCRRTFRSAAAGR
ncbi:helix-turn-helix transcriptional regulator [Streptomyces sp. JH34]|uniref:helix-turn-helix transcriptional regulator n=1 Tax=unclassified Streptomyces TaxID=2593676 RepID=UPI0023F9F824|nr:helix-turn-helix transcriptional regulator [Streptomyces sp. JH34]MDF6019510.1 hypothetical protein [Streptomyces sp. JH34]